MARTLRVVQYAVNGAGVGHLTRLTAISRWMRRYADALGRKLEIWFLTSSEADALLFHEGFVSFKVPSKNSAAEAGVDRTAYLALAKQWVWHSLALLRPDLLVVDSFPRGSFGELLGALDLCRKRAFVFRPMKRSFALRADFQAMLPLYDRILVPERDAPVPVPEAARDKVVHTGPVLSRERCELLPREEARARIAAAEGSLVVYVSAGGGGDPGAAAHLESAVGALAADPSLHLVVGAGPLYRGRPLAAANLTWIAGLHAAELMNGFDLAVCAAGYNTFGELMQAGVPAIFLPQEKIADEQDARAARAVAAGCGRLLPPGPLRDTLPAALLPWRDAAGRAKAAAAARALLPENGARRAAAELMRLLVPEEEAERAETLADDRILAAAVELSLPEPLLFETARALLARRADGEETDPDEAVAEAVRLARDAVSRGLPAEAALRAAARGGTA